MSRSGRLAAVLVLSLELLGTPASRADAGAGANQSGLARRTKPVRLELSYVWSEPLIPAAGGAAVPSAATPPAPSAPHADGAQVALAILITLVGDATGVAVALRAQSIWAGMIPMAVAPFGAGAIVCNIGASTPGRGDRCRATLAGALLGAAAGLAPGILILATSGSAPKTEDAYYAWSQTQLSGAEVALILYTIGMPLGTVIGYNVGGATQSDPTTMPRVAAAPLFTLRF